MSYGMLNLHSIRHHRAVHSIRTVRCVIREAECQQARAHACGKIIQKFKKLRSVHPCPRGQIAQVVLPVYLRLHSAARARLALRPRHETAKATLGL